MSDSLKRKYKVSTSTKGVWKRPTQYPDHPKKSTLFDKPIGALASAQQREDMNEK